MAFGKLGPRHQQTPLVLSTGNEVVQRLVTLQILTFLVVSALIGRLYHLQFLDTHIRQLAHSVEKTTTRYVPVIPRRGEILARDGQTLLAESTPTFALAVLPDQLPSETRRAEERAIVLARLAQIAELTSTLTLSRPLDLALPSTLADELAALEPVVIEGPKLPTSGQPVAEYPGEELSHTTMLIPPRHTMAAMEVAARYPALLTIQNPVEVQLQQSTMPHYQFTIIKEHIPREVALAVQENRAYLPGVVVIEHYRRRYPFSGEIPSLSHLLGYIGRISQCELVAKNPATSWSESLQDVLSNITQCGIVPKHIDASLVGISAYLRDDWIGKDGLEASYEWSLRGTIGIEAVLVDALERPVAERRVLRHVRDGNNLILTIRPEYQRETAAILQRWIDEAERRRIASTDYRREFQPITNGVAIVMDTRNGEILSMVSLPTYDNNIWVAPERAGELRELLSPSDPARRNEIARLAPLTNRAISGQYPPGSVLKQFVGAIALQEGVINAGTRLRDPGRLVLQEQGGSFHVLPNASWRDNGFINVSDALKVSSNVFFASISGGNEGAINLGPTDYRIRGLTIGRLSEGLRWFHFGQPTQVDLPGEATGRVPTPIWKAHLLREPWTTGDTYNTAIGQGYLEVTPLQLVTAAAAIANGGILYRPHLVREIRDSQGTVLSTSEPQILARIPVAPEHLAVIREGMRRSVTEGANVAARDAISGLSIAGKTGTAEFGPVIARGNGYQIRQSHSWFVGFAPYDNPEVIALALIEGSGDLGDGSATLAVPAVTELLQAYFRQKSQF